MCVVLNIFYIWLEGITSTRMDVLVATKGERLLCHREVDNLYDLFIVVIKNDYVVGHVPKKISIY